jgi:hypothetical protein
MKNFLKKKIYFLAVLVSFTTLFSSVLYAQFIPCDEDIDCPEGLRCLQPEGICVVGIPEITCSQYVLYGIPSVCYVPDNRVYPPCTWTGAQVDICTWL